MSVRVVSDGLNKDYRLVYPLPSKCYSIPNIILHNKRLRGCLVTTFGKDSSEGKNLRRIVLGGYSYWTLNNLKNCLEQIFHNNHFL